MAMSKVGRKGVVTLEEGKSAENSLYVVEGMQFDRGYISPYFVTDSEKMTVEFENCKIAQIYAIPVSASRSDGFCSWQLGHLSSFRSVLLSTLMAAAKPSPDTNNSRPQAYPQSICRVAVAQICLTVGYRGAEAAALHALTDIAGRYIRLLAGEATTAANSHGRTQSNILDLAVALEGAAAGRGFAGAADVSRPLLRSPVLRELRDFVAAADEIPFPQPMRRPAAADGARKQRPSFAQAGRSPAWRHVPRWLPCFPDGWDGGGGGGSPSKKELKTEQKERPAILRSPAVAGRDMVKERTKVRFGWKRKRKRAVIGKCGGFAMIERDLEPEEFDDLKLCSWRRLDSNPDYFYENFAVADQKFSPACPADKTELEVV